MDRERYDNGSTYLIEMNTEWRNCAFLRKIQACAKIITKYCSKNICKTPKNIQNTQKWFTNVKQ